MNKTFDYRRPRVREIFCRLEIDMAKNLIIVGRNKRNYHKKKIINLNPKKNNHHSLRFIRKIGVHFLKNLKKKNEGCDVLVNSAANFSKKIEKISQNKYKKIFN